ncbi:uncharacterized protein BJ171DRAFT_551739 [Polychytrium aggregatum]|uniref:uncharacterized protein n=1 Tax=Polychytrium aggregatum TaxID=110093 RepID=UPI0022FDC46E|nr:uncharacterized protein BJ171DRAFT_551739 [Polychytrium aggregatum]KAI9187542.1 hypothetical protein BJ171DRAFT_551739 [Polychytrium aggregatum]
MGSNIEKLNKNMLEWKETKSTVTPISSISDATHALNLSLGSLGALNPLGSASAHPLTATASSLTATDPNVFAPLFNAQLKALSEKTGLDYKVIPYDTHFDIVVQKKNPFTAYRTPMAHPWYSLTADQQTFTGDLRGKILNSVKLNDWAQMTYPHWDTAEGWLKRGIPPPPKGWVPGQIIMDDSEVQEIYKFVSETMLKKAEQPLMDFLSDVGNRKVIGYHAFAGGLIPKENRISGANNDNAKTLQLANDVVKALSTAFDKVIPSLLSMGIINADAAGGAKRTLKEFFMSWGFTMNSSNIVSSVMNAFNKSLSKIHRTGDMEPFTNADDRQKLMYSYANADAQAAATTRKAVDYETKRSQTDNLDYYADVYLKDHIDTYANLMFQMCALTGILLAYTLVQEKADELITQRKRDGSLDITRFIGIKKTQLYEDMETLSSGGVVYSDRADKSEWHNPETIKKIIIKVRELTPARA